MESLREKILAVQDKTTKAMEVPEWGATVYIRSWTAGDRSKVMGFVNKTRDDASKNAECNCRTLVLSLVREDGEAIFNDKDVPALLEKNGVVIERIIAEILEFNAAGVSAKN